MATLTHEKWENLGPVIHENIITKILFTCCSVKFSYHKDFHVYGITFIPWYGEIFYHKYSNDQMIKGSHGDPYILCVNVIIVVEHLTFHLMLPYIINMVDTE